MIWKKSREFGENLGVVQKNLMPFILKIASILFLQHSLNVAVSVSDDILCNCTWFLLMSHDTLT